MKTETKLKKALAEPNKNLRLLKLYNIALQAIPNSPIQKQVVLEIEKLRDTNKAD